MSAAKNAIIFHGTNSTPEDFWYPWLAEQLRSRGYTVEVPHYPDINRTPIEQFLPQVRSAHTFNDQTILIGHSAGSPLILSLLEHIDTPVAASFLVAGFSSPLPDGKNPILQPTYDWPTIKAHAGDVYIINSINDPWGCDNQQGRAMFDHLSGTLIIREDGHFGSRAHSQPYTTFELLDRLIS